MDKNRFGLIGFPLGHSMSEVIHKELFRMKGLDCDYDMIEVAVQDLKSVFDTRLRGYRGFNVTIPHKINIIPFLDKLSDRAELFGAVNTVDIHNGVATGHNTDCIGFLRALKGAGIELAGRVLLCGSGGVARMIAFESVLAGAQLTIAVRPDDLGAANEIKTELKQKTGKSCDIILLSEATGGYDLVINGTPVGMYPNVDACPLNESVIRASQAAFDVIYNPQETRFISCAKEAGLKYSGGLSMLVWQAAVAEEIWNDVSFTTEDIEKVIKITGKELTAK